MLLRRKLLISVSVFLLALLCLLGAILFSYGAREIEQTGAANLDVIGGKMAWQFDNLVRPMDFISVNLIATDNFMRSMSAIANIPRGIPQNDVYISEAMRYIYVTLCNDAINKNFYSVNVFNEKGDLFSSRIQQPNIATIPGEMLSGFSWMPAVNELKGKTLLIPPHTDPWNSGQSVRVFSLIRSVQGDVGRTGYVEVQRSIEELDHILTVPGAEGLKVALLDKNRTLFCSSGFVSQEEAASFLEAPSRKDYIALAVPAEFTGFELRLYQNRSALLKPLQSILQVAMFMTLALLLASALFAVALYRQFVKPIRRLRGRMEGIELETLYDELPAEVSPNNEILALEHSFSMLRGRLSEAVNRQLRSQTLQLQANYDALQLQINPHFLYNVLNVISHRGMCIGDDDICRICSDLATMLRYSTSTKQRTGTIREELSHAEAYVSLMQKRYENRIAFSVEADEASLPCEVPKMILLQFVENAIKHSFEAGRKLVAIRVRCDKLPGGWRLAIEDDGPGFDRVTLDALRAGIPALRKRLLSQSADFAIGGMGLLNTYARLWLFFGDCVGVTLDDRPGGGARVVIELREGGGAA